LILYSVTEDNKLLNKKNHRFILLPLYFQTPFLQDSSKQTKNEQSQSTKNQTKSNQIKPNQTKSNQSKQTNAPILVL